MSVRICDFSDLPKGQCAHCKGGNFDDSVDIGIVFPARFEGECPSCHFDINPSDECRMVDGVAWCRACADQEERYAL